ncbi:MAG: hypothetical protein IT365_24430 [Candidatus Hydrogenedentes bacterium]|nr:hypothetical protein [Candidatus Hydrogenedentota bacterium]
MDGDALYASVPMMETIWIEDKQLVRALRRNEAFWQGELEESPLMWIVVPNARQGPALPEPEREDELWTDVNYVIVSTESNLSRTHYAGDALPVFNPWLGPDQFAAWLGADMTIKPKENTSWIRPFIEDWDKHRELTISPQNRWWRIYLDTLRASVEAGKGKWVTGYPDLHSGIDALSAIRGPERLSMDLVERPEAVHRAMCQMTDLWKCVVDTVSNIILPAGQGTSNWTMGWSERRFLCIGQNDFTCMIGPEMFEEFCLRDNVECCNDADYSLYHLDGPDAARHLPKILGIDSLTAVQWIQGAGNPPPSKWLHLLQMIQRAGKSVQVYYGPSHGDDADLFQEMEILCRELDPTRLFIWAILADVEEAEALVKHARKVCSS